MELGRFLDELERIERQQNADVSRIEGRRKARTESRKAAIR
jgi:hypothetical protein